jgi:hypothetical protein
MTAFVMTDEAKRSVASGFALRDIRHPIDQEGILTARPDLPEAAIGIEEQMLFSWVADAGLAVELFYLGWWAHENSPTYQDFLVQNRMSKFKGLEKHCEPAWLQGAACRDQRMRWIDEVMQDRDACYKVEAFGHEYCQHGVRAGDHHGNRDAPAIHFAAKQRQKIRGKVRCNDFGVLEQIETRKDRVVARAGSNIENTRSPPEPRAAKRKPADDQCAEIGCAGVFGGIIAGLFCKLLSIQPEQRGVDSPASRSRPIASLILPCLRASSKSMIAHP